MKIIKSISTSKTLFFTFIEEGFISKKELQEIKQVCKNTGVKVLTTAELLTLL